MSFSPDGRRLASAGWDQTVRIWEASVVSEDVLRKRGLVEKVNYLFRDLLFREKVLAALQRDHTLGQANRVFALQLAQKHPEDSEQLNQAAWEAVKTRDAGKDAYGRARRHAEAAVNLAPKDGNILNTLGVAQYRTGRYADALVTLTKDREFIAEKPGSLPAVLAFQAMAQHQLGKEDKAKATLGQLRNVMKEPLWAQNAEATGFLREVEELIEGKAAGKGKRFARRS